MSDTTSSTSGATRTFGGVEVPSFTLAQQIDNMSKLIEDMEAERYDKTMGHLAKAKAYTTSPEPRTLRDLSFCCLGCMSWQLGARADFAGDLSLRLGDDVLEFDDAYPPLFVGDAFGLEYMRNRGRDQGIEIVTKVNGLSRSEYVSPAYFDLASMNDADASFDTSIIPRLRETLAIMQQEYDKQQHEVGVTGDDSTNPA